MEVLKKILPVAVIITAFLVGTAGYMAVGKTLFDAMYGSFALFFVNPVFDEVSPMIEAARWSAGFVTTAAIFYALKRIVDAIREVFLLYFSDSVAVYSDTDRKISFEDTGRSVVYAGREVKPGAKTHIFLLDSDKDNLQLYEDNRGRLKGRDVFIRLKEINFGLVREIAAGENVNFFDMDGAIARNLWKQIRLWENVGKKETLNIAIIGTGHLGQSILNTGLLMNIFSLDQKITYYFVGDDDLYEKAHGAIPLMNRDSVVYGRPGDGDYWKRIADADLVIAAQILSTEMLQTLGVLVRNRKFYYYAPQEGGVGDFLKIPSLIPFGRDQEIYTEANICRNETIQAAIDANWTYTLNYGSDEAKAMGREGGWRSLDGFTQWSNISSADFGIVLYALGREHGVDEETLAEFEHIRWSRFHYLNFWVYGTPENGAAKDKQKRIHTCLVPYADLSETDKEKDRDVVRDALAGRRGKA